MHPIEAVRNDRARKAIAALGFVAAYLFLLTIIALALP